MGEVIDCPTIFEVSRSVSLHFVFTKCSVFHEGGVLE
jgi:hypothetical protein